MDTTYLHTFTAGRFEVTVRVSVVKIREVSTAFDDPETTGTPELEMLSDLFDDPTIPEIDGARYAAGPAAEARAKLAEHQSVSTDDIRRAALRVTEIGGGRGSKTARWAAMCDLLELWVRRYGDPPRWSEVAEPGGGHDPIAIGHWFGNERGRLRNGKMTVAQRERMNQLLGEGWAAMRRTPYGVDK